MKTRTKIIWICLGYLIFGAFAVDRIVMFINGNIATHKLIIGLHVSAVHICLHITTIDC